MNLPIRARKLLPAHVKLVHESLELFHTVLQQSSEKMRHAISLSLSKKLIKQRVRLVLSKEPVAQPAYSRSRRCPPDCSA